ncbi:hypothetical protein RJ641_029232, partial [Dillenia turbinata]
MANEIKMARAVISKRFLSISIESPLFINLRNCKAYAQPHIHNHITKHRLPRISCPQFSFSYSSSSSSSSSKVGFVGWCLAEIESRPLFTNCITSSLICTAADLTSKVFLDEDYDIPVIQSGLHLARVTESRLFSIGYFHEQMIGRFQSAGKTRYGYNLQEAAHGTGHIWTFIQQHILLPECCITTSTEFYIDLLGIFISYWLLIFDDNPGANSGESAGDIVARLKRDLLPTLRNDLIYWPFCDFFSHSKKSLSSY